MFKIDKNKKYFFIALYAFGVLAALILSAAILLRFHTVLLIIRRFFSFLSPVIYGLVIAYFCNPLMKLIERRVLHFIARPRLRRVLSIALTYFSLLLVLIGILALVIPQILNNYDRLVESLVSLFNTFADSFNEWFADLQRELDFDSDFRLSFSTITHFLLSSNASGMLETLPLTILQSILTAAISVFFSICILIHKETISLVTKKLLALILPNKAYHGLLKTAKITDRTFGRFFIAQIFDSLVLGIVTFLILWVIHLVTGQMHYYALISVLVAVTNVIPYFGPFIGAIPSAIIVLTDSVTMMFVFIVVILILQQIEGNIINPAIVGKVIGLDSIWIIIAIMLMGNIMGMLGMLVGVPIFSLIYTALKALVERRLKKVELPVETSAYEHVFSSGESPFTAVPDLARSEPQRNDVPATPASEDKKQSKEGSV